MFKSVVTAALITITANAYADDSDGPNTVGVPAHNEASHAVICRMFAGTPDDVGQSVKRHCEEQAQQAHQEPVRQWVARPLPDCIKPGNVIDDTVRNCMKGL